MERGSGHRRLTRAESKARTRGRILEAAARVIARDGYAGASVEEIAEAAGYSVGAVYSNFESKEHLFAELLVDQRSVRLARLAAALEADGTRGERLARLAHLVGEFADGGIAAAAFGGDAGPRAFRDPGLRRVIVERLREAGDDVGDVVASWLASEGIVSDSPPAAVAVAVTAMVQGLVRRRRADPKSAPDDVIEMALTWLVAGLAA